MLLQFTAGQRRYGFVEGTRGYIVTDNDFCHVLTALDASIELNICGSFEELYKSFTLEEIRALAEPVPSMQQWAHYWGIKERVHGNYRRFLDSMRDADADTPDMPEWGKEVEAEAA